MGLIRSIARFLQFHLGPDPVENPSRNNSDAQRAVDYCGIVIVNEDDFRPTDFPGLATPFARAGREDCGGGAQRVPAASVEPPHKSEYRIGGRARS